MCCALGTGSVEGGGDTCQQLNTEGAIWTCGRPFRPWGTGKLVEIDGIMKEKAYNKALVGHGWPSRVLGVGQRFIFRDYDQKHLPDCSLNHMWQMKFTGTLKFKNCSLYDVARCQYLQPLFTMAAYHMRKGRCKITELRSIHSTRGKDNERLSTMCVALPVVWLNESSKFWVSWKIISTILNDPLELHQCWIFRRCSDSMPESCTAATASKGSPNTKYS